MPQHRPPFSMTKPLYDQSTFIGRVKQFYTITDPRSLFITTAQLKNAQCLLSAFHSKEIPPGTTDADLWDARRIVESVIHPSTGKPITPLLRFSMYAPMNIFIVSAMLLPSTINSIPRTIAVHWYNQSYNAAVNYTNGSSVTGVSTSRLVEGYVGAVGSSLAIALGATFLAQKATNLGLFWNTVIRSTLPFAAVVTAGCVNVALIRRNELTDGVEVYDKDNTLHGLSAVAGRQGILQCCAARFFWNVPAMIVPSAFMGYMASKPMWMKLPSKVRTGTEILVITLMLMIGVPPALGLFPQRATISADKLEEKFQNLVDKNGNPVKTLYYNKGL